MRLLNTETQELIFLPEKGRVRYAILSHTWEDDEVLFVDMVGQDDDWRQKAGAEKVLGSCQLARNEGYQYIWIDTCCIDKSSSAELSEGEFSINSMFNWYMSAEVCYVYLTDVAEDGSIAKCRWFGRGWTLQELIAPESVHFYDRKWCFINDKVSISSELASITGIDEALLRCGHKLDPQLLVSHDMTGTRLARYGSSSTSCPCGRPFAMDTLDELANYCVAQKMSWAASRTTTREEDMAYSLMGLFEVNMPLLYGEGRTRAFLRLQKTILENTQDQSILAFEHHATGPKTIALASFPIQFQHSGLVHFRRNLTRVAKVDTYYSITTEFTKFGVNVELLIVPEVLPAGSTTVSWFGILDFQVGQNPLGRPAIHLHQIEESEGSSVVCVRKPGLFEISPDHPHHAREFGQFVGRFRAGPYRELHMEAIRREKVTILQRLDEHGTSSYKEGLAVPIHCVSNSSSCQPYSVECEISSRAIFHKGGYPRLLVETFQDDSTTGYTSLIWILKELDLHYPDYAMNARHLLNELENYRIGHQFEEVGLMRNDIVLGNQGQFYPGYNVLVVRGSPDLKVEVKVLPVKFLDWTTPEVTVTTTRI